ncbi:Noc2p family-domain-containing protein [Melampsora americana]|nr:Noc2p family-domain-containing protein [Melampsora americana]
MAGKKIAKRTKKFTKNHLDHTLKTRRKQQAKKQEIEGRKQARSIKSGRGHGPKSAAKPAGSDDDDMEGGNSDDDDEDHIPARPRLDMSLDALLNAEGLADPGESDQEDGFSSDDDLKSLGSAEGSLSTGMDLKALKEKDPEFYKYLEENDRELLNFDAEKMDADDDEKPESEDEDLSDDDEEKDQDTHVAVVLTRELLRSWQKSIIETKSIRALRKLLLAFRSAAFCAKQTDGEVQLPFSIESSSLFNSVVSTTFRYIPVFMNLTVPAKELPNGKFKVASNNKMHASVQRILKSYFSSLLELISQLPSRSGEGKDDENESMIQQAIRESAKLTPWIINNRKIVQNWTKALLELWSTADDQIRMASFLALRRLAVASADTTKESLMKGVYTNLIRASKHTATFTLPAINLMKNSASELFLLNQEAAYPIIFSYIRQLAIHLRNSMKIKTKEGFQAVYNWQYIHSLDFWSLVLSTACDTTDSSKTPSPLQPLIYPLVQITTGVMKLIPTSRYFPLRLHCARLLLRIMQRTGTFIPLAPFLFDTVDSALFQRRPKPSNLKPLDLEYLVRCPKQYEHTRAYADTVANETIFLLLEYYTCQSKSIAFPELVLPAIVTLRRFGKTASNRNLASQIRVLVEKLEANATWIEECRAGLSFGPSDRSQVESFLQKASEASKAPLVSHLRLQSKVRLQKRAVLDRPTQDAIEAD